MAANVRASCKIIGLECLDTCYRSTLILYCIPFYSAVRCAIIPCSLPVYREENSQARCTCNGLRACAAFCDDGVAHMAPGTDVNFDEVACCSSLVLHTGLDVCGAPFVRQLHSTHSVNSRTPLCVPAPSKRALKASCPEAIGAES